MLKAENTVDHRPEIFEHKSATRIGVAIVIDRDIEVAHAGADAESAPRPVLKIQAHVEQRPFVATELDRKRETLGAKTQFRRKRIAI